MAKQHVFREHDDRCLYCDVYAQDPEGTASCAGEGADAPEFEDEGEEVGR